MGWKPGKYLGKAIKSIGRGIKKIGKGIGKAFKKVFKGIGNFIGKLGPIGMLGMMLLMPQLGAWWGQFGTWADTLVSSGKFFGKVMKGIHSAGAAVGNAYSTVTEGIQKTLNVVTGGTFSTAGTVGYEAGFSDKFATWMGGKMDSAREFIGLETATPIGTPDLTDVSGGVDTSIVPDTTTGPDFISGKKDLEVTGGARYDSKAGQIVDASGADKIKAVADIGKDTSKLSKLEKVGLGISTTSGAINLAQQAAGLGYEDDYGYGGFVADVSIPLYDSYQTAQVDWTNQGYAGTPAFGAGNPGYFQSVINSYGTDPWYMYMQRTQQV